MTAYLKLLTKQQRLEFLVKYLRLYRRVELYGFRKSEVKYNPSRRCKVGQEKEPPGPELTVGSISNGTWVGADYSADQVEFMMAMDREQSRRGRKINDAEVLKIAKALGYRKE